LVEQRPFKARVQGSIPCWFINAPKEARGKVKSAGLLAVEAPVAVETGIETVIFDYLKDFCKAGINSDTAIIKAKRHCGVILEFFRLRGISEYGQVSRDVLTDYPTWRATNRQDGRNHKIPRLAREIPLTPTMRKLYERGYIFERITRTNRISQKGGTAFAAWAESILRKAEHDTGITEINLHRFRHTCATAHLSAGWELIRVSRMLGHSSINTTANHYAEYDLSASSAGFEGMLEVYGEFVRWMDEGYF